MSPSPFKHVSTIAWPPFLFPLLTTVSSTECSYSESSPLVLGVRWPSTGRVVQEVTEGLSDRTWVTKSLRMVGQSISWWLTWRADRGEGVVDCDKFCIFVLLRSIFYCRFVLHYKRSCESSSCERKPRSGSILNKKQQLDKLHILHIFHTRFLEAPSKIRVLQFERRACIWIKGFNSQTMEMERRMRKTYKISPRPTSVHIFLTPCLMLLSHAVNTMASDLCVSWPLQIIITNSRPPMSHTWNGGYVGCSGSVLRKGFSTSYTSTIYLTPILQNKAQGSEYHWPDHFERFGGPVNSRHLSNPEKGSKGVKSPKLYWHILSDPYKFKTIGSPQVALHLPSQYSLEYGKIQLLNSSE